MYRLLILLCSFVLFSCTEEPVFQAGTGTLVAKTFFSDSAGQTKTSLVEGKKVYWTDGDRISVFDDVDFLNRPFMSSRIDGAKAEFSGYTKDGASQYVALYPYRQGASYDGTVIRTSLPASQKAVKDGFDTDLNIMTALTADDHLSFRNACALVKITVPEGLTDVSSLALVSCSPLCGNVKITCEGDSQPVMVPADAGSGKELILSADAGMTMLPGNYYFVIVPGEHRFSIVIRTSEGEMYARASSVQKTVDANQIINLGQLECSRSSHPCALVTATDIARVKASVATASASDPVYASYLRFCNNKYAQSSYTPSPVEILVRGDATGTGVGGQNYMNAARDAAAAFQLALRWQISGETVYADAAVNILDSWADVCTKITANDNNQYLAAGFQGYTFANAAELLREYEGWAGADQDDFKSWLRDVWLVKNEWFIDTHGGDNNCDLHYWSNWELANLASIMAIGIYLDDYSLVDKVRDNFLDGTGSGAIGNMIPYAPFADPDGHGMLAQNMESGRDQGHATLVISMCAELCQMAWNVGLDFWGQDGDKVLAMCQYTAKYNVKPSGSYLTSTMPFTPYSYCKPGCGCSNKSHGADHTVISENGRGTLRPCWDLIYSHYRHEKKASSADVYYVKLFADQLRYTDGVLTGDGGSGDSRYGSNSGAFDQIGWGTMLFYRGE